MKLINSDIQYDYIINGSKRVLIKTLHKCSKAKTI